MIAWDISSTASLSAESGNDRGKGGEVGEQIGTGMGGEMV